MPRHGATAQGPADPVPGEPAARRRRGLVNWPIRRKLVALVAGPLLVILAGGALVTADAVRQLRSAQDAEKITSTASLSNRLSQQLQKELIDTLTALDRKDSGGPRLAVERQWNTTDAAMAQLLTAISDPPRGSWDYKTNEYVDKVRAQSKKLKALRDDVFKGGIVGTPTSKGVPTAPSTDAVPSTVVTDYGSVIDAPRNLTQRLGQRLAAVATDGTTVNNAAAIAALAEASTAAAQEIIFTDAALLDRKLPASTNSQIANLQVRQTALLTLARVHATDAEKIQIDAISGDDERIGRFRSEAIDVFSKSGSKLREAAAQQEPQFREATKQRLLNLDEAVAKIVSDGETQASDARQAALTRVVAVGGGALLLLLLVGAFAAAVARSVSSPLRRLRSAAVETANERLPAAVQRIDREGPDAVVVLPPVLPAGEAGGPETAEVARAVDGLASEAVRLASAQVRLRRSLDDAFVSMSRRSQSMVEKQLAIIDELERTEEDPDQLRNLFRLDHLAARMRRYNDNLLVLAGSVVRTRSNAPVPIADVFRAATSEMEQYERVRLQPVSGAAVSGPAAGGLIHLLAELLDNAAMYSPPTSPILMAAAFTTDGALRLEITDSGVGIPGNELDELNIRLASPGSFDMQVPSRMGLYVVGRLAQRGGFGVQLSQRNGAAGTVAEVVVPAHLVIGGSGLVAEQPRTPTSLPQLGATGRAPVSPAVGLPALAADVPTGPAPERDTTPARRTPAPATAGAEATNRLAALPRRTRGEVPPLTDADRHVGQRTTGQEPTPADGNRPPFEEAPAARTAPPGSPDGSPTAIPVVAPSDEPLSPLPSRRPGAALAAGPLGAGAVVPPAPATPGPAPSPFAASAAAPPETAVPNGAGSNGSRAAGGFGAPGRPFTAGATAGRRATGAGAPSAATAAAAAAAARAARAARAGGSGPGAASALFAARGPATDGRGASPVEADTDGSSNGPDVHGAPEEAAAPLGAVALTEQDSAEAPRTTGSLAGPPPVGAAAPAAWDAAPAASAVRREAPEDHDGTDSTDGTTDEQPARPVQASDEPLTGEIPLAAMAPAGTPIFDTVSTWFTTDGNTGETDRVIDLRDTPASTHSRAASTRWSSLGDQRWLATNARAAAGPEVAGTTEVGLPRRRPGANLIASAAAAAAPITAPAPRSESSRRATAPSGSRPEGPGRVDADAVRGRLSSYQRGLTSARRARHLPTDRSDGGLFAGGSGGDNNPGHTPGEQGG